MGTNFTFYVRHPQMTFKLCKVKQNFDRMQDMTDRASLKH